METKTQSESTVVQGRVTCVLRLLEAKLSI